MQKGSNSITQSITINKHRCENNKIFDGKSIIQIMKIYSESAMNILENLYAFPLPFKRKTHWPDLVSSYFAST